MAGDLTATWDPGLDPETEKGRLWKKWQDPRGAWPSVTRTAHHTGLRSTTVLWLRETPTLGAKGRERLFCKSKITLE